MSRTALSKRPSRNLDLASWSERAVVGEAVRRLRPEELNAGGLTSFGALLGLRLLWLCLRFCLALHLHDSIGELEDVERYERKRGPR